MNPDEDTRFAVGLAETADLQSGHFGQHAVYRIYRENGSFIEEGEVNGKY